jgi:hypothetical protein
MAGVNRTVEAGRELVSGEARTSVLVMVMTLATSHPENHPGQYRCGGIILVLRTSLAQKVFFHLIKFLFGNFTSSISLF